MLDGAHRRRSAPIPTQAQSSTVPTTTYDPLDAGFEAYYAAQVAAHTRSHSNLWHRLKQRRRLFESAPLRIPSQTWWKSCRRSPTTRPPTTHDFLAGRQLKSDMQSLMRPEVLSRWIPPEASPSSQHNIVTARLAAVSTGAAVGGKPL